MIFTIVGVFGSWAVGLALALLLRTRIPGRRHLQGAAAAALGGAGRGVVDGVELAGRHQQQPASPCCSRTLGLGDAAVPRRPDLAAITVCVFKVWISFPFMMMMTSAALASVDPTVYEAARMDGASQMAAVPVDHPADDRPIHLHLAGSS